MSREVEIGALSSWIELVCRAGDAHVRDRVLLECVVALGSARAAALWRRTGADSAAPWRMVLARGPAEALPGPALFESLLERALPADSIRGVRVFRAQGVALSLGGIDDHDDALDIVESLLFTFALMDTQGDDAPPAPPLPSAPRESMDARRLRHDINNVLTSLRATEDLLHHYSDELSTEEKARFRAVVEHECARVGELLASAVRAEPSPIAATCDPARVVDGVLDAERASCDRACIQVRRFVDPTVRSLEAGLSASDLARIVQNLVVNAREALAGRASATISVTLELAPGGSRRRVRLLVEDDGPGLPPGAVEQVFASGFSTKGSTASGQGLSIVRSLAEQAGGAARLGSRASGGSRFEVDLPVRERMRTAAPRFGDSESPRDRG